MSKIIIYACTITLVYLLPLSVTANDTESEICNVSIDGVSPNNNIDEAEAIWSAQSYSQSGKTEALPILKGGLSSTRNTPFEGRLNQTLSFALPEGITTGGTSWNREIQQEGLDIVQVITVGKSERASESGTWKDLVFSDHLKTQADYWCPGGTPRADYVRCEVTDTSYRINAHKEFDTGNISECSYSIVLTSARGRGLTVTEYSSKQLRSP